MLKWIIPAALAEESDWNEGLWNTSANWSTQSLPANDFDFDVVEDLYLNTPEESESGSSAGAGAVDFDSDSFDIDIGLF